MKSKYIFLLLFSLIFGEIVSAQNNQAVTEIKSQSDKLEKAIQSNDEKKQAETYIAIADTYYNQNNFVKSEEYLQKAKQLYEKIQDNNALSTVTRKLAQTQEQQNKLLIAADNYKKAAKYSTSKSKENANNNDYSRIISKSTTDKEKAIQRNISINETDNPTELIKDYSNLADVNIEQKNIPKATENLNNAYEISRNLQPQQALVFNKKITDLYVESKDFDKAIATKKKVLDENFVKNNSQEKVNQIQELANIYLQSNNTTQAEKLLKDAYKIAIEKGHTLEAHNSVLKLDSLYNSENNRDRSISLYKDFLTQLPKLLQKDQSLVDTKLLKETEDKIAQLEKEKILNQELIKKKNLFNYVLIAGLISAIGFLIFALSTHKKLKNKNKKIQLQSLRREMNPHFIFNSLNSVNHFISENNEIAANAYLSKFSKLMRGVMENSAEDFIQFQDEMDLLRNYLALEKSRFQDKFNYEIIVDQSLEHSHILIPGMLIQPFLENAIWHGLRYRENAGLLMLNIQKSQHKILINIDDNGIGMQQSEKQKTTHQKSKNGRGMKNTQERIRLLNDLYGKNITTTITDKPNAEGVIVHIEVEI